MAFTYDEQYLNTTTAIGRRNSVRLLMGDTDSTDAQMTDAEIAFALDQAGDNVYSAAAWASRSLSSKYSRKVTTEIDQSIRVEYSSLAKQYRELATNIETQGKKSGGGALGVVGGGLLKSTVDAVRLQTNRVKPSFTRDRFRSERDGDADDYSNENY